MFERYSEPARRVIFYSRYMAHQVGSPEIETEHLLLGLLRADMGLAQRFLGSPWVAEEIWQEIERSKPALAVAPGTVDLPLSATAKRVLLLVAEEADQLSSKKIRTEHLLLGLLRDEKCLAAVLLQERGLGLVSTRE
jgi:ATP-dependent Clp protease ATP-binding subunit ClpC